MPSITINFTAAEGNRAAHAVGLIKNLKDGNGAPRDATLAECKQYDIDRWKALVRSQEQQEAAQAAAAAVTDIDPT